MNFSSTIRNSFYPSLQKSLQDLIGNEPGLSGSLSTLQTNIKQNSLSDRTSVVLQDDQNIQNQAKTLLRKIEQGNQIDNYELVDIQKSSKTFIVQLQEEKDKVSAALASKNAYLSLTWKQGIGEENKRLVQEQQQYLKQSLEQIDGILNSHMQFAINLPTDDQLQLEQAQNENTALKQELDQLKSDTQNAASEIGSYISQLTQTLNAAQQQLVELTSQHKLQLDKAQNELTQQLTELTSQHQQELTNSQNEKQKEIERLQQQLTELTSQHQLQLDKLKNAAQNAAQNSQSENAALKLEIEQAQNEKQQEIERLTSQHQLQLDKSLGENNTIQQQLEQLKQQLVEAQNKLTQQLDQAKSEAQQQLVELTSQHKLQLDKAQNELTQQLTESQNAAQSAQSENTELQQQLDLLKQELQENKNSNSELTQKLVDSTEKLSEQTKIAKLEKLKQQKLIKELQTYLEQAQKEREQGKRQTTESKTKYNELEQQFKQLQLQNIDANERVNQVEQKLSQISKAYQEISDQKIELEKNIQIKQNEQESRHAQALSLLQQKLEELEAQKLNDNDNVKQMQQNLLTLHTEYEELKEQNDEFRNGDSFNVALKEIQSMQITKQTRKLSDNQCYQLLLQALLHMYQHTKLSCNSSPKTDKDQKLKEIFNDKDHQISGININSGIFEPLLNKRDKQILLAVLCLSDSDFTNATCNTPGSIRTNFAIDEKCMRNIYLNYLFDQVDTFYSAQSKLGIHNATQVKDTLKPTNTCNSYGSLKAIFDKLFPKNLVEREFEANDRLTNQAPLNLFKKQEIYDMCQDFVKRQMENGNKDKATSGKK